MNAADRHANNIGDVNAFQAALLGRAYYESLYPTCNWLNADINGDGNVDFGDLNPFVNLVSGGGNAALAQTLTWDTEAVSWRGLNGHRQSLSRHCATA